MKHNLKKWYIPLFLILILVGEWGTVLLLKGTPKVIAWWLIHCTSLIGIIAVITSIILIIKNTVKHKKITTSLITLILGVVMSWPIGWFLGIGQIAYPADINTTKPSVQIRLPLEEETIVGWGGDRLETNYHVTVPVQRWAYDLLIAPAGIGSNKLEDYGIFGKDLIAPASGIVISAYDDDSDMTPGNIDHAYKGNHIYIQLDETGTYLVMEHLMQNSILVEEGQHIQEGMVIAKVGNSGNSSEPHLHIHHQKQNPATTSLFLSEGLPLYFRDITGSPMPLGGVHVQDGKDVPIGDIISPITAN